MPWASGPTAYRGVLLAISLTKSVGFTAFTGPMHFTVTAAELLSECYSVDQTCGVSEAVTKKLEETALPAVMWLDRGVMEMLSRGGI